MENKKVEVIEKKKDVKLCPFISGFLIEPAKTALGDMTVAKTTNIAPCIEEKCKFYNPADKDCEILLCFKLQRKDISVRRNNE